MRTYRVNPSVFSWFASSVPGKPEHSFLTAEGERATEPSRLVWCLGTLRLGQPHRDVDLLTLGEEVTDRAPVTGEVSVELMEFRSAVDGQVRRLEKLRARSAEGREVTLTANPPAWFRDINAEYAEGRRQLLLGGEVATAYHRLRAEGRKVEAYALLGIRMSEQRA